MYPPLKCWLITLFPVLEIAETVRVSLVQENPAETNLTQYEASYFRVVQPTPPPVPPPLRVPGPSAAASNWGGIVRWENSTQRFAWRRKRQAVGRTVSFQFPVKVTPLKRVIYRS